MAAIFTPFAIMALVIATAFAVMYVLETRASWKLFLRMRDENRADRAAWRQENDRLRDENRRLRLIVDYLPEPDE